MKTNQRHPHKPASISRRQLCAALASSGLATLLTACNNALVPSAEPHTSPAVFDTTPRPKQLVSKTTLALTEPRRTRTAQPPAIADPLPLHPAAKPLAITQTPVMEIIAPTPSPIPQSSPSPSPVPAQTPSPKPSPTPSPTPTPNPLLSPLSGLPIHIDIADRRVVAIKIDNAPAARPQSGLSAASVVYEHLTEGTVTRYTAFFLDHDVRRVGPIRSARFVDRDLVQQFDALFAHVGGSPPVRDDLGESNVADMDQFFFDETRPYYRISSRPAPFNMYADLQALREHGQGRYPDKRTISGFRFYDTAPNQGPLTHLQIPKTPRTPFQARYTYASNTRRWRRSIGETVDVDAETGRPLEFENIIVQRVSTRITKFDEDSLGNKSLWIGTTGENATTVFRDGAQYDGRWRRETATDTTEFFTEHGSPIALRPGHTWIHLLAEGDEVHAS